MGVIEERLILSPSKACHLGKNMDLAKGEGKKPDVSLSALIIYWFFHPKGLTT